MFGTSLTIGDDILDIGTQKYDRQNDQRAIGSGAMVPRLALGEPGQFEVPNVTDVSIILYYCIFSGLHIILLPHSPMYNYILYHKYIQPAHFCRNNFASACGNSDAGQTVKFAKGTTTLIICASVPTYFAVDHFDLPSFSLLFLMCIP